jgi:hypothetical protein
MAEGLEGNKGKYAGGGSVTDVVGFGASLLGLNIGPVVKPKILSRVFVSKDGGGELIYWIFTSRNYN